MKKLKKFYKIDKMAYKGLFKPNNPQKYKGNINNIIYRSSWEHRFMRYCDRTKDILEWGSEEIFINYSSIDGKTRKYFPDFYMKVKQPNNTDKKFIVEIKPKYQTLKPKIPKRKTSKYMKQLFSYMKNKRKWSTAIAWCKKRNMNFIVLTEDHLKTF